ncbi:MAG TPA: thioesterase [Candidatus Stackebrandtia faecavium]|nr:thioesterase [Candidatus Stackebrandtia faecavium]
MRYLPDIADTSGTGINGRVEAQVTQADTAQTLGSGDVPVLGTPRVLALAEAATVSALTRRIETRFTSVGTRVELRHLAATRLGTTVWAEAVLRERDGNRLVFDVRVIDDADRVIAEGMLERALIDREEFMSRVDGA